MSEQCSRARPHGPPHTPGAFQVDVMRIPVPHPHLTPRALAAVPRCPELTQILLVSAAQLLWLQYLVCTVHLSAEEQPLSIRQQLLNQSL